MALGVWFAPLAVVAAVLAVSLIGPASTPRETAASFGEDLASVALIGALLLGCAALGYGLLLLNRAAYVAIIGLLVAGSILNLIDRHALRDIIGQSGLWVWIAYLLLPDVRRAFRF